MLELRGVNTYYGESHILHDVSLTVKKGEIVSLQGRNGVGKSTTMRTIMGLTPPRRGNIIFKGCEISKLKPFKIAQLGVGFVPEERWIFPSLTVHQNILVGIKEGKAAQPGEQNGVKWTIERCYDTFPLLRKKQLTKGGKLSGGEQQMLTIVRTLMGNPDLILIDEPTEGLAPLIVEEVADIISLINKEGLSVLLVEQKLAISLRLADRMYVMSKGTIQWEGTPEELEQNKEVRTKFLEV